MQEQKQTLTPLAISNRYLSVAIMMSIGILFLMTSGCSMGSADEQAEQRYSVSGEVTFNSTPLPLGRIIFIPADNKGGVRATGTIIEGKYSIKKANGPIAGKMRVEIQEEVIEIEGLEAQRGKDRTKTPMEFQEIQIPKQFNAQSTLVTEIKTDEENKKDFHLTAKVKKRR